MLSAEIFLFHCQCLQKAWSVLLLLKMEVVKRKVDGEVLDDCGLKSSKKKKAMDPECGTLVFCGTTDFANVLKPAKLAERSFHSKLNVHEPVLLAALQGVRIRHVGSGPEAGHLFVVDEAGKVSRATFIYSVVRYMHYCYICSSGLVLGKQ